MKQFNRLTILAIETSCDDTGIAVLKIENCKLKILSNIVSSQIEIHKKYGGVYPSLAKREHQKNIIPVLKKALEKARMLKMQKSKIKNQNDNPKFKIIRDILEREKDLQKKLVSFFQKYQKPHIDLIAVTIGPGLEPCLWVGINFAKALAYYWNIPIVPVNHVEAHIFANFVGKSQISTHSTGSGLDIRLSSVEAILSGAEGSNRKSQIFPAVCLVVSGGHTQIILMKGIGKYKILGGTRDDAAGECFDKTARILGLPYPGGPSIAAEAAKLKIVNCKLKIVLPRPMINTKDYDFSFSGLKTAVLYQYQKSKINPFDRLRVDPERSRRIKNQNYIRAMAVEIQQAIIDVLIKKTIKAAKDFKAKTIILGGGVASNAELRKQFAKKIQHLTPKTKYLIPKTQLCTDNALMVAVTGYFRKAKKIAWQKLSGQANLRI